MALCTGVLSGSALGRVLSLVLFSVSMHLQIHEDSVAKHETKHNAVRNIRGSSVHRAIAGRHKLAAVQDRVIEMVVQGTAAAGVLRGKVTAAVVQGMANVVAVQGTVTATVARGMATAMAVQDKETVDPGKANLKAQAVLAAQAAAGGHSPAGMTRGGTPVVAEGAWNSYQQEE